MQNCNSKFKSDINRRCFEFSVKIIALVDSLPNKRASWVISDQLIRSATSIGANLIEARASSSRLEYKKFYEIALKSANETKYWLALLCACGLCARGDIAPLEQETIEIAKMLASGVMKLKGRKF